MKKKKLVYAACAVIVIVTAVACWLVLSVQPESSYTQSEKSLFVVLLLFGIMTAGLIVLALVSPLFRGKRVKDMNGVEFERYVAAALKRKGFRKISMTPITGDYGVDITAERDGVRYAFQCKRYSSPVGVAAVQQIYSGSHKYGAERAVVVTNSTYTPNAKILADDLGVTLWDLEMLDAIL